MHLTRKRRKKSIQRPYNKKTPQHQYKLNKKNLYNPATKQKWKAAHKARPQHRKTRCKPSYLQQTSKPLQLPTPKLHTPCCHDSNRTRLTTLLQVSRLGRNGELLRKNKGWMLYNLYCYCNHFPCFLLHIKYWDLTNCLFLFIVTRLASAQRLKGRLPGRLKLPEHLA